MNPENLWIVGGNGNLFADINGHRYCVAHNTVNKDTVYYTVLRDGVEIAGPECLSGPAGFNTLEAAQKYVVMFSVY